ncbi:MAG: hypothetical protein HYZ28_25835 [Myxococcales bacterium]|nr:hypothetical protein [Myxococcales bacterium]
MDQFQTTAEEVSAGSSHGFTSFGELFDAADPETESDRVLVAAYWRQVAEGASEFASYPVNTLLKETGNTVSNITRAFDTLIAQSPRLVLQIKKAGRSKQARKTYKITREGLRRVETMLTGGVKRS